MREITIKYGRNDALEAQSALKVVEILLLLNTISENIRSHQKYDKPESPEECLDEIQQIICESGFLELLV